MPISQAPLGTWLVISALEGPSRVCARLREMGIVLGERVCVQHRMPWSGPVVIAIGSATFALRASEASCLIVK